MSLLPAVAALALGAAGLLSAFALAARSAALGVGVRVLAALGAAALLPALAEPGARGLAAFSVVAALRPRPLSCLLASASALLLSLRPAGASGEAAALLAAAAAAMAISALDSSLLARLASGADPSWAASAGGASLGVVLVTADHGRVLGWGYGLGSAGARLELPGAGLLFGLTLLVVLAGALLLAANALTGGREAGDGRGRERFAALTGRRLLVLAAGLGVLGIGLVLLEGLSRHEAALTASAVEVAGLVAATGALAVGVLFLLGERAEGDSARFEGSAAAETRVAAVLAVLAMAGAGYEGWLRAGTYGTRAVAQISAAAVLGLGAAQPTRFGVLRRAVFAAGLLSLLV